MSFNRKKNIHPFGNAATSKLKTKLKNHILISGIIKFVYKKYTFSYNNHIPKKDVQQEICQVFALSPSPCTYRLINAAIHTIGAECHKYKNQKTYLHLGLK